MDTQTTAALSLFLSAGVAIYLMATAYRDRRRRNTSMALKDVEAKRWDDSCNDPQHIEYDLEIAKEELPPFKAVNVHEEVNTQDRSYFHDDWRLILPETAMRELHQAFGENSAQAYHVKRAIELSIEHLMEELADDAECARIIEDRVHSNTEPKLFDFEAYSQRRK